MGVFYKLFIVSNPIIEIVSHELILTNKKELQIRLFDVLEELEIDEIGNGATTSKGYFQMRLYSKMYKRQLGNRWKTYFDLLSRDEVQGVEGSRIFNSPKKEDFQVSTYLNHIEKHLDLSKQ